MNVPAGPDRLAARLAYWLVELSWRSVRGAQREWLDALRNELGTVSGGWSQLRWAIGSLSAAWQLQHRGVAARWLWRVAAGGALLVITVQAVVALQFGTLSLLLVGLCAMAVGLLIVGGGRAWFTAGLSHTGGGTLVMRRTPVVALPVLVLVALLGLAGIAAAGSAAQSDPQCTQPHASSLQPPVVLASAADFLALGDYDYERGACTEAIADYTRAIELDPTFAAAYNDRAYAAMREQNYAAALPDLDRAIELRPDYPRALMNRGDIYNYYYHVDRQRALADYDRVIALGATDDVASICGHRLLAYYNGWSPNVVWNVLREGPNGGCHVGT